MKTAVVGAGAFGTALAISLAQESPVVLWCRSSKHADEMARTRQNHRRLPGAKLPEDLRVTPDPEDIRDCDTILLAVPMQALRGFLADHARALEGKHLVACCKGAESASGLGPTGVVKDVITNTNAAILTGPSFAADIAKGLPTALTLACANNGAARDLQAGLTTRTLRLYRTADVIGAELGGALKNVIAIGCGTVMGAGLGESARAALMTRGYAEMTRFAVSRGAQAETLAGLSGLGDLALTCTSGQSRNYRRGLALGRNVQFDPGVTVEGAATAKAMVERAQALSIELPVAAAVDALLDGRLAVEGAMHELLARPLKEE